MILDILMDLFFFVITLSILIIVHEYGHFLVARFFKIKVEQFSIGFGPVLWRWNGREGTKYVISFFLIGGYVKFFDKEITSIHLDHTSYGLYHLQHVWKRSFIVLAGPVFNFIFSILLYIIVFTIGMPVYKPVINYILPNSIIAQNKVLIGSEIKLINNIVVTDWESVRLQILNNVNKKKITITTNCTHNNTMQNNNYILYLPHNWLHQSIIKTKDPLIALGIFPDFVYVKSVSTTSEYFLFDQQKNLKIGDKILLINLKPIYNKEVFSNFFKNNSNKKFNMIIERNNNLLSLDCQSYSLDMNNVKNINFFLDTFIFKTNQNFEVHKYELFVAILKSCIKTWNLICFIMESTIHLLFGDIKISELHGPLSIAKGVKQSIHAGVSHYLLFLAMISINLGVFNLLPLPILDGGQLFFLLLEKIAGKKISKKTQDFIYIVNFIVLICIAFLALYNDVITW